MASEITTSTTDAKRDMDDVRVLTPAYSSWWSSLYHAYPAIAMPRVTILPVSHAPVVLHTSEWRATADSVPKYMVAVVSTST